MSKVLILLVSIIVVCANVIPNQESFQLQIIHLNDFHARFEETSKTAGICKEDCIGGFSRVFSAIQHLKRENQHAIVLNGGDNFQGTLWYNLYKWNVTQRFLNMLPTDAYTLGNHEFDDKVKGVVPFLDALNAPTVVANIDDSQEPAIQGKYKKSTVIERQGKRIGIIGVILSTTNEMASTENVKFLDESESVNKEAERLVQEENVDTIIVLSHCGYDRDILMAKKASPKIGIIVGAHSHTFLYTGDNPPGGGWPAGPYPTIIDHDDGRKVLVVQAGAYTKYLGNITVNYDSNGDVVSWSGAPIYLDSSIPQDQTVNEEISKWKKDVDEFGNVVLGATKAVLEQRTCRVKECNFGNFLADSMVYAHLETKEPGAWTSAAIALLNAGSIRTSLSIGNITYSDLVTAQPFENTYDIGEIQGKHIKEVLERSIRFDNRNPNYYFNMLQVSGLRIVYNITEPVGSKIQMVRVLCRTCLIPKYEELNFEKYYKIVVNSFLGNGGDGFGMLKEYLINKKTGPLDTDVLQEYIKHQSPIIEPVDDRIILIR